MKIHVYTMSGAGNIFSVIDNRQYGFTVERLRQLAIHCCKGNNDIKQTTEGLIALESHEDLDFNALFFNPDGSYGAMCGNGGRCAVSLAAKMGLIHKLNNEKVIFHMASSVYEAVINDDDVISLFFPPPKQVFPILKYSLNNKVIDLGYVDVGSDHAVIKFEELGIDNDFRKFDINAVAGKIRYADEFEPKGVNVNIYQIIDKVIHLRTYERGVEAETGACGTGSISTAIIAAINEGLHFPVVIVPPSGIKLTVDIKGELPYEIERITLTGNAKIIEEADINIPEHIMN